jgi:hypothetical protein
MAGKAASNARRANAKITVKNTFALISYPPPQMGYRDRQSVIGNHKPVVSYML